MATDLQVGTVPTGVAARELWLLLGNQWRLLGGRWGGDFDMPPGQINEREMNHFDLGLQLRTNPS